MRELADANRIRMFMREFGRMSREQASIFFAGGATAVLVGWRGTTMDIDMRLEPDHDALLRALVELKERLEQIVAGTRWTMVDVISSDGPNYVAVLERNR